MSFKLTYSTMFSPPPELHTHFDAAMARVRANLGATHPLFVDGTDRAAAHHARGTIPRRQRVAESSLGECQRRR
jgi:1-pyrroline-5-carboxylate dehydrogenase